MHRYEVLEWIGLNEGRSSFSYSYQEINPNPQEKNNLIIGEDIHIGDRRRGSVYLLIYFTVPAHEDFGKAVGTKAVV